MFVIWEESLLRSEEEPFPGARLIAIVLGPWCFRSYEVLFALAGHLLDMAEKSSGSCDRVFECLVWLRTR